MYTFLKNKKKVFASLILITCVSFLYRLTGIQHNDPFWIDEFSSANQARLLLNHGLQVFSNPYFHIEYHNLTSNSLIAFFFKLFGEQEWTARLPFVLIGSLIPALMFLLSFQLFGIPTALGASLLGIFSYYQITWSRQARGYPLLQLLVLLLLYLYVKFLKRGTLSHLEYVIALITIVTGVTTHSFFFILIFMICAHYVLFNRHQIQTILKKPLVYIVSFIVLVIIIKTSIMSGFITTIASYSVGIYNNVWYYHSFLWREYGLITFLAIVGYLLGIIRQKKVVSIVVAYIALHLIFVSFFYGHYISKYLNPIFPLVLIGAAYGIRSISSLFIISRRGGSTGGGPKEGATRPLVKAGSTFWDEGEAGPLLIIITICFSIFIIANGYKFTTKPKSFYSVNHDFREIALIDYHSIYGRIKDKINSSQNEKIAVVDTWSERSYWYLGQDYQPLYVIRWKTGNFSIVGQRIARSSFTFNSEHEKVMSDTNNVKLIEDVSDLKHMMKKYKKGFMFIDDASLPHDVIDYAEKNLKKELYIDHYPLDDNPYSIWPATLYSWGF